MEPISSTPKKKKRDQNLVRSIEADLDRLRDEVIRTREELEYEKIIRRTAEEQLSIATQEKIAESQKATDSHISDSKLQHLLSQLEEANMAITKLSAEKADLMIQLELKGGDLSTSEERLGKMQKAHSTNLQDKSELLEELNQLVDVLNSEKQKYEFELAELNRTKEENIEMLEHKEQFLAGCRREIGERDLKMKRMESEMKSYRVEIEYSKRQTEELKLKIRELEKVETESASVRKNLSDLRKLNSELVATNTKLLEDRNRIAQESQERDAHIEQLREEKLTAEKQAHRLQGLLQSREMGIEDFESKRLNSMQKEVEQLANTLGELMEANNGQQNVICSLHDSIRRKDLQLSEFKANKHDCEISLAKLRTESSSLQSKLIELETSDARADTQAELTHLKKLISEEEEKINSILRENKSLQSQKQEVMKAYSQLAEENNKKSLQLVKLKQRAKQQDSENKSLREKLQQSDNFLQAKSSDVSNLREALKLQKSRHTSVPKGTLQRDTHSAPSVVGRKLVPVHSADSPSPHRELFQELQNLRTSYRQIQNVCKHLEQQLAEERRVKESHELGYSTQSQLQYLDQEKPKSKKDSEKQLVRAEQNMIEAHDWYQERIYSLEQELSMAKCSAEDLEKANKSYEKNLQDESQMRINQGREAGNLIHENRETIRELTERTSQAENDQTHSQRVIAQLSKRLVKSIQDYKYLQEISMSRCQELALEAKPKQ